MPNVPQDGPREAGDQALMLLRCVDISWGWMRDGGGGREGRGETIGRRVARDRIVGNRAVGLPACESGTSSSWLWSLDSLSSESAGFWKLRRVVLVYL